MDTPALLCYQYTTATKKKVGFPKLCFCVPALLPPLCDTNGEFILNHIVVIQAAFGCLLSVSPTVVCRFFMSAR